MFEPTGAPRVFGLPSGVDFPKALIDGVLERCKTRPPEFLTSVEIYVNTRRMQRRIREIFDAGPPRLLPSVNLITDLGKIAALGHLPPAVPKLQRRLELAQLVAKLVDRQPDLAPRASVYDLADSLASLMDEMQSEGVPPEVIETLDISDQSGHWERALRFVKLTQAYFGETANEHPDSEARQRLVVERLTAKWVSNPPHNPIIIAGSTGSRGATHMLMQAVAKLPQGALVLPGYDFDLPDHVWAAMDDAMSAADHPQFRFRALQNSLGISSEDISEWVKTAPPSAARNRLVSLALRPAPVTDQWMAEGPKLTDLQAASENMTLVQAPSARIEALTIALKLRQAAEIGQTAALITPDRILTRQVTAALDQWGIEPDDSAGLPLPMSAPGRFLLQIAGLFGQVLTSETLLALLKHPLTHSGDAGRGDHLRWARDLELHIRKNGPPFPTKDSLSTWANAQADDGRREWAAWLGDLLDRLDTVSTRPLTDHLEQHLALARALAAGPADDGSGELWEKPAGQKALEQVNELQHSACHGGVLAPFDYNNLFRNLLNQAEVHDPTRPHPNIMIWGTLEARVQGADLVILGGLNDGIWPSAPNPDPWMNRAMRQKAGLLLPERQIGLSAHDFQQAIAAKEVWLTRAVRDAEAQTVPSRWLNRLTNLLGGLKGTGGADALKAMHARGNAWLDMVAKMEHISVSIPPETRPSPIPPTNAQPKSLSVTGITKLIRDPYAVYAGKVLRLYPLDPIRQQPDAPVAGTVIHKILERFIDERADETRDQAKARLMQIADDVLAADAPWPAARRVWRAKLARVADWFLQGEVDRAKLAKVFKLEQTGAAKLGALDFTLTARADRLDRSDNGLTYIYDYKTGKPPTEKQQIEFDKQLLLTAAMVERAGFKGLADTRVGGAAFIGLGASPEVVPAPLEKTDLNTIWADLETLITAYTAGKKGYTSRRAMEKTSYSYDYDHLARYGEWDESDLPKQETLT
ncbi:double-strand break repair protein AddB [Profundibacter sp.]|uniref:double-strand break repair protein AddB n=1 Tax=Profundibacter sp. TaxID=3101071 RepID=UPI003D0D7D3D